jgi:hypothetical protein
MTLPPLSNDDSKENGAKQGFLPHLVPMNAGSPTEGGQAHLWLMHDVHSSPLPHEECVYCMRRVETRPRPRVQNAFKNSMIHGIM